jgi:hypothetical protein
MGGQVGCLTPARKQELVNYMRASKPSYLFIIASVLMVVYIGIHVALAQEEIQPAPLKISAAALQTPNAPVPFPVTERPNSSLEYINTGLLAGVLGLLGYALLMVRKNEVVNNSLSVALIGYEGKGGGVVDRLAMLEAGRHTNEVAILTQAARIDLLNAQQAEFRAGLGKLGAEFNDCQLSCRARKAAD